MSRLTVSVVSPGLPPPPGGLQQLALDAHVGLSLLTTTRTIGISSTATHHEGVDVVPSGRLAAARLAAAAIAHVRRFEPDVVQAITWKVATPVVPFVPRLLAIYAHGAELVRPGAVLGRLRNATLNRADVVIANSAFTASLVADMSTTSVRVISPGVHLPARTSDRRKAGDRLNVISVGALVPRKGHDRLIRAVHAAAADGTPMRLVVVGDGPERANLERLVVALGAQDHVELAGRLSEESLDAAYREADVFALLGHAVGDEFEGFGIVLLEAAAYGLPVVTTLTGGTADAVQPGENALIVDDVDSAADVLRMLWRDDSLAARLAANGRLFAQASTIDHRAQQFLDLYNALG